MRRGWVWGASLTIVMVAVAGCSPSGPDRNVVPTGLTESGTQTGDPTTSTQTPDGETLPTMPARPAEAVSVEAPVPLDWGKDLGGTLKAWVHPVQSSAADGLSLLTVELERPADGGAPSSGFMINFISTGPSTAPSGFNLFDAASGTVAQPLKLTDGWAATSDVDVIEAGGSLTISVAFPALTAASAFVTVPGFDMVEVPVTQEASTAWPDIAKEWAAAPEKVGAFVAVESWAMSLVTQSTVEVAGDQVFVELPADVLFAFGKSNLSGKAQKVVDKAARKIAEAAAESGEITVVGHTDDQGDASFNMALSKARAETVADRLRPILGSTFVVKTEGRGSKEPKVKGTSDDARAANRRVEITFTGRSANKLVVVDDVPTELPDTLGAVATGLGTARVPANQLNPELDARVVSLRRVGGQLVGVLEIAAPTTRASTGLLFGDATRTLGSRAERGFGFASIANVSLLTATTRVFPADFRPGTGTNPDERRVLGSQVAEMLPVPGGPHRYVFVWPDVDPSATTVTVDAPDAYRFLDVPIG